MLSICIPTFNRADLLEKNFKHLLTFTQLDFELNVSNNGSVDHTQEVIEQYRGKFPKFNSVTFKNTIGRVENWDSVIRMATGDYVFALADDDNSLEQGLIEAIELLDSNKQIGAVYGGYKEYTLEETFITDTYKCETLELYDNTTRLELVSKYWSFEVPVFRRDVYERASPIHQNTGALSWLFLNGVFKEGLQVAVSPFVLFKHYIHKDRVTEQLSADAHLNFVCISEMECYLADSNASAQAKFSAMFTYLSQLYNFQAQVCLRNSDFLQARYFINKGFLYNPQHFGPLVQQWDRNYLLGATVQEIRARIALKSYLSRVIVCAPEEDERDFLTTHFSDLPVDAVEATSSLEGVSYDPQTDFVVGFSEASLDHLKSNHNVAEFRSVLNSLKFTQSDIEINLGDAA